MSSSSREQSRASLPVLLSVVVVDLIGFGIVMPILPFYAREFGVDATTLGILLTAYAVAQSVCAPLWGRLSDRVGRRRVVLGTVAGTSLSLALLGLAPSLVWLFTARVLSGAFAANVSVASAYIADVTTEQERTRWMGLLGASFGIGFLLGPAIGGLLAPHGNDVPMLAAAGLAAANFVYAAAVLREPARHAREEGAAAPRLGVLRNPLVLRLCLAYFGLSVAVTQLETVFAFYMMDVFSYEAREVAFILVAMAIVMGSIQAGGLRALAARFRERALVTTGVLLLAGAFVAVPLAGSVPALLVWLTVLAVGRAIAQPSLMSLVSMAATPRSRGTVMGTFQSSASVARIVGPVLAGALYDAALPAPFWLASAVLVGVALLHRALPAAEAPASGGAPGEAAARSEAPGPAPGG